MLALLALLTLFLPGGPYASVAAAAAAAAAAPSSVCANATRPMDFRTVRALAFEICLQDAVCAQRFYIAHATFDIGLFRHFFDRFVAELGAHDYLVANYANDAVKRGWLYTMRKASFCTDNEMPSDDGAECVCRAGRICHEESPSAYSIDIASFTVLLAAVLVATVGFSLAHLEKLRVIDADVRLLRHEAHLVEAAATSAHGTKGGGVGVGDTAAVAASSQVGGRILQVGGPVQNGARVAERRAETGSIRFLPNT